MKIRTVIHRSPLYYVQEKGMHQMSLEEILNSITILQNNCSSPDAMPYTLFLCGMILTTAAIAIFVTARTNLALSASNITLSVIIMMLGLGSIVFAIIALTNESVHLSLININLYVSLNDVPIEDISKYFKLSDTISNDGQIYANITPVYEHSDELRQILHTLEII